MSGSTVSAPDATHRLPRLLRLLGVALFTLLAGCGPAEVVVQGKFPTPLMQKLPLTLGVWYDEDFAHHEFFEEAKTKAESSWIVRTGEAQVQMWDTLLDGMFTRVVHMNGRPGPGQMNPTVDAVLIPAVDELQYAIPTQTNIKVYEIWMRYRLSLVTTGGKPITDWTMAAYGKTPTAFLQSDEDAVNLAAVMALRDAGANFATGFPKLPAVQALLRQKLNKTAPAPEEATL